MSNSNNFSHNDLWEQLLELNEIISKEHKGGVTASGFEIEWSEEIINSFNKFIENNKDLNVQNINEKVNIELRDDKTNGDLDLDTVFN